MHDDVGRSAEERRKSWRSNFVLMPEKRARHWCGSLPTSLWASVEIANNSMIEGAFVQWHRKC